MEADLKVAMAEEVLLVGKVPQGNVEERVRRPNNKI